MSASTGACLLADGAERSYREHLLPWATVVTPNRAEAAALCGRPLPTVDDLLDGGRQLAASGPAVVVITGGDCDGDQSIDIVIAGSAVQHLRAPRIRTGNDRGTGCSFAAATAARLALGDDPLTAVQRAKSYVHRSLAGATTWRVGAGAGPIDHLGWTSDTNTHEPPGSTP